MSEVEKIYIVGEEFKDTIINFLQNPFDLTLESINLLRSKSKFTEKEINQVISVLGKFPADQVYPIIDLFKLNLKVEEVGKEE